MGSRERIHAYCQKVTEQVRWKRAHENIAEELEGHIEDQMDAFIQRGATSEDAVEMAVKEMGDPYSVGLSLDRLHRPRAQSSMILFVMALSLIGFFVRFLLVEIFDSSNNLMDDALFLAVGIAVMMLFYFADVTLIGKYPLAIYCMAFTTGLLALQFSSRINGRAYMDVLAYYMNIGYLSLIYPIAVAALIYRMRRHRYLGIILSWCGIMGLNYILVKVPMMVAVMHLSVIGLTLMLAAAYRDWFEIGKIKGLLLSSALFLSSGSMFAIIMIGNERIKDRLSYQLISHGRFLGAGSGVDESLLTSVGLGDIWTDNIVAFSVYTYGWLPVIALLAIMFFYLIKGIRHSLLQKSMLGLLVSLSIVLSMAMQVINYLLYNFGIGISGTLSLPFISYSTTALIINLALTGLMLSVFRNGDEVRDKSFTYIDDAHAYSTLALQQRKDVNG